MDEREELLRKIHAYRRDRENVWSRFDTLLTLGHRVVEYARAGRKQAKEDLKLITRWINEILSDTPIYAT